MSDGQRLLEIKDLRISFSVGEDTVRAVNGVSLTLDRGEALGVVGESGCGKSVTFSSVMGLLPSPPAVIEGEIVFDGRDVTKLSDRQMRRVRGKDIAMIFQEPMRSLNPVMRIGNQIVEALLLHGAVSRGQVWTRALELLKLVEVPDAPSRLHCYPHQLSGGLRQRIMIAMALASQPRILLADEPTTALDVTIQAQILELLKRVQRETGMSIVIITHDLGVVADIVDNVAVFYAGVIVEKADKYSLFRSPMHPYTIGLLNCIPTLQTKRKRLYVIEGNIPDPARLPIGCAFSPRCAYATERCLTEKPETRECAPGHFCACHLAGQIDPLNP
ncbi:MAG: ABC transporter ATP-binding protein [Oscillospiraceae bacterium]|jgi:peptide/nickel transport system ATP-binding protein/oligopeptide transport system ATP-binding protein|nr:ABC transporter ATP-binding protein [Oscillospiraceae bacterium]